MKRVFRRTATVAFMIFATSAQAAVTISTDPTSNMVCSGGVCSPTATDAVLNVSDLEALLASGNVTVTTTGSGVQANDIDITSALSWSATSTMALDVYHSITIGASISVTGTGSVVLTNNDGGRGGKIAYAGGNIYFAYLSSGLSINSHPYTLASSIAQLAADIAAAPKGRYALANSYDASANGTYTASPIPTKFKGAFDGLGNSISNLSLGGTAAGLFYEIENGGTSRNIDLMSANVSSGSNIAGPLVGYNYGIVENCSATGTVGGSSTYAGGLIGANYGVVLRSYSNASVSGSLSAGGLAGGNTGTIRTSYATGSVSGSLYAGGLVGQTNYGGFIADSHATGQATTSDSGLAGGLAGYNGGWLENTYATGSVTSGTTSYGGGLVGFDYLGARISRSFATGDVNGGSYSMIGGLDGVELGATDNSYATGSVAAGKLSSVGGFLGCAGTCGDHSGGQVQDSYSTGTVSRNKSGYAGGFAGTDLTSGAIAFSYWDTTTSGLSRGTGNRRNEPGLKGKTTTELQSGLPRGFKPSIWAEDPNINGGLPYLKANPPQ